MELSHPSLADRFDPAIRVAEHDPGWAAAAAAELARIGAALGPLGLRLEHIGSTAVPGLAAKPILDLMVSVADVEAGAFVAPLERLGYLYAPSPGFRFFALPPKRPRTHHVHVFAVGGEHERRHLAVRDFLRAHPEDAAAYEAVKRRVALEHPQDRLAYIAGKEAHVVALEQRALAWAARR